MNIYLMKKPKRVNSVSVTIFIGGLLIAYLVYWWGPILWPVFRMTGIMKAACNEAYRVLDDEVVMSKLVTSALRTRLRVDKRNFRFRRVPYTEEERQKKGYKDDDTFPVKRGKRCEIDFRYAADYPVPFTGRSIHLVFERTVTASLETVKYDKFCTCVSVPGGRDPITLVAPEPETTPPPRATDDGLDAAEPSLPPAGQR